MKSDHENTGLRPPKLATWLAGARLDKAEREFQIGDLIEEYQEVVAPECGHRIARRWYWKQAVRCFLGLGLPPRPTLASRYRSGGISGFGRDLSFAVRMMRRTPLVSAAVILTFALGIGANIAMFRVAWPVLLAPLPLQDEDSLTRIWLTYQTDSGLTNNSVSPADYHDLRTATNFESVVAFARFTNEANLTGGGVPEQVTLGHVTADLFATLGIEPVLGRTLQASDLTDVPDALVLSETLWRTRLGARTDILGTPLRLDGDSYTVVGVLPDSAGIGTRSVDAWGLLNLEDETGRKRRAYYLGVLGRLKPGITIAAANQELDAIMARAAEDYPESNAGIGARAVPLRDELTAPVRTTILVLVGGAGLVLLIAGVNLAGLQRARQGARRRELAVRLALGATRSRLALQILAEGLMMAVLGGLAGIICALFTQAVIAQMLPAALLTLSPRGSDIPMLVYAAVLTALAGLAISAFPAWSGSTMSPGLAIRSRTAGAERTSSWTRSGVVAGQIAITAMLLIAATLTGTSLARLLMVDPGFATDGVLVANFSLPGEAYPTTSTRTNFYNALIEHLEAVPGVSRGCVANDVPLDNQQSNMTWVVPGKTRMVGSIPKSASPGCFEAMGIGLLQGNLFDTQEGTSQVVLSASMARQLWPDGTNPIGRQIHMGVPTGPLFTVTGVVEDIRNGALESDYGRQVWMSYTSGYWTPKRLVLKTSVPPSGLTATTRETVASIDRQLALADVRTMDDIVEGATAGRRFVIALLGGFALIAIVLSAVGVYGLLTHTVGQRTQEIGIRMALGAQTRDIVRLVTAHLAMSVVVGISGAVVGAWMLSTILATMLYQTSSTDMSIYLAVITLVAGIAAGAAWVPTRRALKTDPLRALQHE